MPRGKTPSRRTDAAGNAKQSPPRARTVREISLDARCQHLATIARRLRTQRDALLAQVQSATAGLSATQQALSRELSKPASIARTNSLAGFPKNIVLATELETLLRQELDVESLLRTTLEFMLKRVGTTNAAIFLPQTTGDFSLGAYVNYDFPRERAEDAFEQLGGVIAARYEKLPGMHALPASFPREIAKERSAEQDTNADAFDDADAPIPFPFGARGPRTKDRQGDGAARDDGPTSGEALGLLSSASAIVYCCRDARECLCVMIVFRDRRQGFDETQRETLRTIGTLFGQQLARIAKTHNRHLKIDPQGGGNEGESWRDDQRPMDGPGLAA